MNTNYINNFQRDGMATENMSEQIRQELSDMMKENSPKLLMYFVSLAGERVVNTNSESITITEEATFNGQRYEIVNITSVKKAK